jgi:hypothetical protein
MKFVGALTACLVFGAAHGRLSLRQRLLQQAAESAEQTAKANEAAKAEARNQRSAGPDVTAVGKVEQQKPLTGDGINALAQQQAEMHALTSRHASQTNFIVQNRVDRTTESELQTLLNQPFYNAFSMVDLNLYKESGWHSDILKSIDKHSSEVSRIGLALSTGAPVIQFVKELMHLMNMPDEVMDLTKRGHEYTNFMQECEESVAGIFFKLYSVFAASRSAAQDLEAPSSFQLMDASLKTYVIGEANYSLKKAGQYVTDIVDLIEQMIERSEDLKLKMQSKIEGSTEELNNLGNTKFGKNITNANAQLDAIKARKEELAQQRVTIDAEIADLEARMDASSSELQKKLQARSGLLDNITPEKRENSPAHWRMFYEELCTWFAEWDCKFDATNVFQWVVDPTPIKALYVDATKEIEELQKLHDQRISRVAELVELRKENTKMTIEFAENTGDLLHQISQNVEPMVQSGASKEMYRLAIRKLEQVSLTFGAIKTAFEKWHSNLEITTDRQQEMMRRINAMQEHSGVEKIVRNAHENTMDVMSLQLLDCAIKGVEAWGAMDDIEYFRTFYMTTIITYDRDQLVEYINDKDVDIIKQTIKGYYVQKDKLDKLNA